MSDIVIEIKGDNPNDSVDTSRGIPQTSNHVAANVEYTTTTSWVDAIAVFAAGTKSIIVSNPGTDVVEVGFAAGTPLGSHVILPGTQREIFPQTFNPIAPLRARHLV